MHTAKLITIGDELLIGRTVNTNAAWLGEQLSRLNVPVVRSVVIPDEREAILQTLATALETASVVILTGGLGATSDDITRSILADFFQTELVEHQPTLEKLQAYFASRGRELDAVNATLARVPAAATPIANDIGAAPGMLFEYNGKLVAALPGVPYEMKHLFSKGVAPEVKSRFTGGWARLHTLRTVGIPETSLARKIQDIEAGLPTGFKLAYNPSFTSLDLRLAALGESSEAERLNREFEGILAALRDRLTLECYGEEDETLEGVLGAALLERQATIATAESCTGGSLSGRILSIAGASRYCDGGIVAYSNAIKHRLLGVPEAMLETHGAVSEATAIAMAQGVRQVFGATYGLATTGVAGPGGGSVAKPVGTVWVGFASEHQAFARHFKFESDRGRNIERTIVAALNIARLSILNERATGV